MIVEQGIKDGKKLALAFLFINNNKKGESKKKKGSNVKI